MTTVEQIVEQIQYGKTFLIAAHENPDGDAIGSSLGLALALRALGKEVTVFNVDPVPEMMRFLPQSDLFCQSVPEDASYDVAFVLDAGDVSRTRLPIRELCRTMINIDHHPHSNFGDICFLDISACATAVLVYRVLVACGHQLDLDTAKALYLGILSDTGSFRYSSANAEAFDVSGRLIALGIDPWEMASQLYESHAPERMRLLGMVLQTLEISDCGRYASMSLTKDVLERSGAMEEHADGFVNYPRSIRGVEVDCFINELADDHYKISFRSRGKVDVGQLARDLGGGGHHNAAGAKIQASLTETRAIIARHLDQLLARS